MTNIEILLYNLSTPEEKMAAANGIITTFDLPLTADKIIRRFEAINNKNTYYGIILMSCERCKFLFETLLNSNKYLFVALINAPLVYAGPHDFINNEEPYKIGYDYTFESINTNTYIIDQYSILLNYNKFEIDDLNIPDECKLILQKKRFELYSGESTKLAEKI